MTIETGYEIAHPCPHEGPAIAEVHARSFEQAYLSLGVASESVRAFVCNDSPTGFYTRILNQWNTLAKGGNLVPDAHDSVLAAREPDGKIVGFVASRQYETRYFTYSVDPMTHRYDSITALYVDPDHQGEGWGSALLCASMSRLGNVVVLETVYGSPAVDFYKRHGFEPRSWASGVVGPLFRETGMTLGRLAMACDSNPYNERSRRL